MMSLRPLVAGVLLLALSGCDPLPVSESGSASAPPSSNRETLLSKSDHVAGGGGTDFEFSYRLSDGRTVTCIKAIEYSGYGNSVALSCDWGRPQ